MMARLNILKKIKKNFRVIKDKKSKNKFGPLNLGIKKSKGQIIGILHSDDFYPSKHVLTDVVRTFKKYQSDVVYGNLLFVIKIKKNKLSEDGYQANLIKKSLNMAGCLHILQFTLFQK